MNATQFILGQEVEAFEEAFAPFVGVDHVIDVNSGTSALHLALLSSGVGPDDEVIAPAMTFIATTAAISYCGGRPVLVDVDPVSCTVDVSKIEPVITPRTKAMIPVHLYGQMADMEAISAIAEAHKLLVIEDGAPAHGATRNGRAASSIGHFGCFSFYPGRSLGGCGEGGAVATKDPEAAKRARVLRDWGQERRYERSVLGYNYRMDGLQDAFFRAELSHLERFPFRRKRIRRF
jgi:dTDP-4-amino-4,6-dideoxygalactose transaminase